MISCFRTQMFLFPLTVALTLGTNVVAKHGTEDEVFLGRETVQRTVDHQADGIHARLLSEEKVDAVVVYRLYNIVDMLVLQTGDGKSLIPFVTGEQHHLPHAFLIFVDVVHENLQVDGSHNWSLHKRNILLLISGCKVKGKKSVVQYLKQMVLPSSGLLRLTYIKELHDYCIFLLKYFACSNTMRTFAVSKG